MKMFRFCLIVSCLVALVSCGGSSSSSDDTTTGDLSIQATVASPTAANLAVPLNKALSKAFALGKTLDESAAEGVEMHCENAAGETISDTCTTDATGTCEITGLTSEELEAGVVVVGDNGMHAYEDYTTAEVDAFETSGDPAPVPVNTETDLSYAVLLVETSGDLSNDDNVDLDALHEAIEAAVGEGDPGTSDLGSYADAALAAHAEAILNAEEGSTPSDAFVDALEGDTTAFVALVGETVSDVPVADAITHFDTMADSVTETYATVDESTGLSSWADVRSDGGDNFDPLAVSGMFRFFTPTEFVNFEPEDFRGFASALPQITGGFAMFRHQETRSALVDQFRLGAFQDPTRAGPALGFLASSLPACPENNCANMVFTGFDSNVAARAANNGFLEYVDGIGSGEFANPEDIFNKFREVLSDGTIRQAWAGGGAGDYIASFVDDPNFDPTIIEARVPPGSACEADTDCLPCDSCVLNVCTSVSPNMGAICTENADCDANGVLICQGGYYLEAVGRCMCASAVPPGGFIHSAEGEGPRNFGVDYIPPAEGAVGAVCGDGHTACPAGSSCVGGVCLPDNFERAAFSACTNNSMCGSGTCTNGVCSLGDDEAGDRIIGQACSAPSDCATFNCSAGVCAEPPEVFVEAAGGDERLADGSACTMPRECQSWNCIGGTCQAMQAGAAPSNIPAGAFCMTNAECASASCNVSMHQCN